MMDRGTEMSFFSYLFVVRCTRRVSINQHLTRQGRRNV